MKSLPLRAGDRAVHSAVIALLATAAAAQSVAAAETADSGLPAVAQAAVADLGKSLRTALQTTMQSTGPAAAVDFCRTEAPRIAAAVGQRHGVSIGRTALNYRNAANAPTDWQQEVLQRFSTQVAGGAAPESLRWQSDSDLPREVSFRYAQGIRTEAVCLVCHGPAVAGPIADVIRTHYPSDRATGFKEGDLRGAFWVEIPTR